MLHEKLMTCGRPTYIKQIHPACATYTLERDTDNNGNVLKVIDDCNFCTKKCYIAYQKYEDVSNLGWNKDGKNGKDDPDHSEQIIVNWLCKWGNYKNTAKVVDMVFRLKQRFVKVCSFLH